VTKSLRVKAQKSSSLVLLLSNLFEELKKNEKKGKTIIITVILWV